MTEQRQSNRDSTKAVSILPLMYLQPPPALRLPTRLKRGFQSVLRYAQLPTFPQVPDSRYLFSVNTFRRLIGFNQAIKWTRYKKTTSLNDSTIFAPNRPGAPRISDPHQPLGNQQTYFLGALVGKRSNCVLPPVYGNPQEINIKKYFPTNRHP